MEVSHCTGICFSRELGLEKHSNGSFFGHRSGSKLHADVLTILASVTDAIKAKGGKENEVEYFAALLNPLTDPDYSHNLLAATSYLLNLVIRKVPKPILIQQFDRVSEIIFGVIRSVAASPMDSDDADSHEVGILRYLLASLGYLLEIRPKPFWTSAPQGIVMVKMLDTILNFTIRPKPRIRKSAQKAVVQIIINNLSPSPVISNRCADFCIQQMEQYGGDQRKNPRADVILHVLNFLQHIIHRFSSADLKKTTETIFKLLALSNHMTSATAVHCLYMMFRNRPTSDSMSADLNAKIVLAIYDFQPSPKDAKSCSNWIMLITEAHACLLERDVNLAAGYISRLAETLARCMATADHTEVVNAAVTAMKKVYGEFVADVMKSTKPSETLEKCLEVLEKLLSAQYYSIWPHVFSLFGTFFEAASSKGCSGLRNFHRSLKTIAELRESEAFPCKLPAEQAVGAAIRYIGPEEVLTALPLGLNASSPSLSVLDFPRSWLLPLLRAKVCGARIGFFASYFLPLAIKIDQRVKELQATGNPDVEVKVLEAIECQIWELFPAFCNRPTDAAESFPTIARALGAALTGRPKLRLSILGGLRKLIQVEIEEKGAPIMAKFGRNFLNILLQLYTSKTAEEPIPDYDDEGVRLAVLETIRSYAPIVPPDLIQTYLNAVLEKVRTESDDAKADGEKKGRLLDILIVITPHLDLNQRRTVYELVVELMAVAENRILKKCWRLMEELCGGSSEASKTFVSSRLTTLRNHLQSDLSKAAPATKACRLRCLLLILDHLKDQNDQYFDFVLSVLPDAVTCLHGTSIKARKCAAKLIVKTVSVLASWKKDVNAALRIVFEKILSENGEKKQTTQELTGAIAASRLICYEFRNDIAADLISYVLGKVCHLLTSENRRPVVQACVEFLKTFVGCFSEITVGQFLDTIVSALCNQNEDCMKHCRRLTRKVMAKLVKRFSYVTVRKHVPASFEKQLKNIKKLVARSEKTATNNEEKKRKGATSVASSVDDETGTVFTAFTNLSRPETIAELLRDTSDEESDEEETAPRRRGKNGKGPAVWLKEGDEEEVIDMMDKKFTQQILATKPKQSTAEVGAGKSTDSKNRGFKTAADGRLVITLEKDEEDDENKTRKRKRRSSVESGDNEAVDLKSTAKKKRAQVEDDFEEDKADERGDDDEGTSTYVPGGKGIHRRLSEGKGAGSKKAKGDKKSKGNVDPYAYVPMNKQALNKRKKAKLGGQFKHLVQGAKKGATKGSKGRKKKLAK